MEMVSWLFPWGLTDTSTALIIGVVVILFLAWLFQVGRKKSRNLPPGPRGWPVLGYLPTLLLSEDPAVTLREEAKRYGEVLSLNLAGQLTVVLSSSRAMKEAYSSTHIQARPHTNMYKTTVPNGHGVGTSSGEHWSVQRKFSMTVLKGFGVGKASFEDNITVEAECALKVIHAHEGGPFDPSHLLGNAVSNVICSVALGKRFEYSDPRFQMLFSTVNQIFETTGSSGTLQFLPIFQKLPFLPVAKEFQRCIGTVMDFIREEVETHRQEFDPDNQNDFIDAYLHKIASSGEDDATGGNPINSDNMLVTVYELFLAGTEATTASLRWTLLFMMAYPDIQSKVQQELDDVVGRNRYPRVADRPNLLYLEATILESLRIALISSLPSPHQATQDTEIQGFNIPKDTIVILNLLAINREKSVWKDPDVFNPDRFIKDGELFPIQKEVHVFGYGTRACFGEPLARMELFIFFSYLLHQFTIKKPEDAPPLSFKFSQGLTLTPLPFQMCAIPRD